MFYAVLLSCIELRDLAIESPSMNGFELRAVDTPLLRRNAQSIENRGQLTVDVTPLVAAHDAPGPVDEGQVVLEAERYAALGFSRGVVVEMQQRFQRRSKIQDIAAGSLFVDRVLQVEFVGQSFPDTGVVGGFRFVRDARPYWVEVDVDHGGEQSFLGLERFRVEAGFPELASAAILSGLHGTHTL
jgi:hypothetical protein